MSIPFVVYKWPYNIYDIINFKYKDRYNLFSIDPASKLNAVFTIERHYNTGNVRTLVSDKQAFSRRNYETIKKYLDKYDYKNIKIVIIEKQLSQNIKASNFSKHLLLYFSLHVDCILIELSPKVKSLMFPQLTGLAGPKLKNATVLVAFKLAKKEHDKRAYKELEEDEKPDDRADTKVQRKALYIWLQRKENKKLLHNYIKVNF